MGVITGAVGGVLRDILCNDVPLIFLQGELYASAAWVGALTMIAVQEAGVAPVYASWAGMAIVLGLRLAAIRFRLVLPTLAQPKRS